MINQVNKYVIEQVFDYEGVDSQKTQELLYHFGMVYFKKFNDQPKVFGCRIVNYDIDGNPKDIIISNLNGTFTETITNCDYKRIMCAFDYEVKPIEVVDAYNQMIKDIVITQSRVLDTLKLGYALIGGDKKLKDTLKAFFSKLREDTPTCPILHIPTDNTTLDISNIKLFNNNFSNLPFEDLQKLKYDLISECYRFFGVDNLDINKKERLITGEVNANNMLFTLSLLRQKNQRLKTINYINSLNEGFNVKLIVNVDETTLEPMEKEESEENTNDTKTTTN